MSDDKNPATINMEKEIPADQQEPKKGFLRDRIKNYNDIQFEEVTAWGEKMLVGTMTAAGRDAFEKSIIIMKGDGTTEQNLANMRAKLAVLTTYNMNKKKLFQVGDEEWLGEKSAAEVQKLFEVAMRLNKISEADVEELAKN